MTLFVISGNRSFRLNSLTNVITSTTTGAVPGLHACRSALTGLIEAALIKTDSVQKNQKLVKANFSFYQTIK